MTVRSTHPLRRTAAMMPSVRPMATSSEDSAGHQRQRRGDARRDQRQHRAALDIGAAEVALDKAGQIAPELQRQRQVEAELMAHVGDHLRIGAAPGDQRRRIGGQGVQQQKGDDGDAEQHAERLAEPLRQQAKHQPRPRCVGSSRSRRASPSRLKASAVARMTAPGMNTSHGAAWK